MNVSVAHKIFLCINIIGFRHAVGALFAMPRW